jgi:hypothetical protein
VEEEFVWLLDGGGDGGMPHIFDSVEFTNLRSGLSGLHNLAFCSGVNSWAWPSLKIPITDIVIVAAITYPTISELVVILLNSRVIHKEYKIFKRYNYERFYLMPCRMKTIFDQIKHYLFLMSFGLIFDFVFS